LRFHELDYAAKLDLYSRYKGGADLGPEAVACGAKLSSLERALRRFGETLVHDSPKPRLDQPPTIGDCLILADIHVPYHDAPFINRCVDIALGMGIKEVAIAGDLLDYNAFSPFDPNVVDTLEAEYAAAENFLGILAGAFARVLRIKGNHDARLDKRIGYHQLPAERARRILTDKPNVVFSDYYHCLCGEWRIAHPKNASTVPGSVAAKLAGKYHCNVVAGHGHLFGVAQDISAHYVGIDSGACVDPARLEYIEARMNTRPCIYQGAVILKGGLPTLIGKHFMRLP
jgi:predicted phosphodiesterase